jgi:hypothetical protein
MKFPIIASAVMFQLSMFKALQKVSFENGTNTQSENRPMSSAFPAKLDAIVL